MQKWFQIMSMISLFVLFFGTPIAVFSLITGFDPEATFRRERGLAAISPYHFTLQWVIWLAIAFLAWAFWLNATAFSKEIERLKSAAEESDPDALSSRPPTPVDQHQTPLARTVQHYEDQGYIKRKSFLGSDDVSLLLYAREARDSNGLFRRKGAIIYPSGDSAIINAGVLYDTDSWEFDSDRKVERARMGSSVKIKTAINRPHIKTLVDSSHHVLTIGLASRRADQNDDTRDFYLSYVRSYNLAYTLWELGWKPKERIYPLFLGAAKASAREPALEALQRSLVFVGVNATVEVLSSDAVTAAMLLIDSNVVDLNAYAFPATTPNTSGRIKPGSGLLNTDEVMKRHEEHLADSEDPSSDATAWTPIKLPPIPQK